MRITSFYFSPCGLAVLIHQIALHIQFPLIVELSHWTLSPTRNSRTETSQHSSRTHQPLCDMHLSAAALSLGSSLLIIMQTVLASPLLPRQDTPTAYYLQTRTLDSSSNKNGLFVSASQTSFGINDVVLTSNATNASQGFLNDTYQYFYLDPAHTWGLNLGLTADHAGELSCHVPPSTDLMRCLFGRLRVEERSEKYSLN